MGSTLNQIAYTIMGKVKPHLTDDSDLTIEEIKNDIAAERTLLLRRDLGSRFRVTESIVSDLGCLELELADAAECCDIITGCKVLRTVKTMPSFVTSKGQEVITRIGPIVKTMRPFNIKKYNSIESAGNGMFNANQVFAYYMNDRIYVFTKDSSYKTLKYINVRGVLENPSDIIDFVCDPIEGGSCYSDDEPYKLTKDLESQIRDKLISVYLQAIQLPKDLTNDGRDQITDNA